MTHHARRFAITITAAAAFLAGGSGAAVAGDPEASDEAEAPGPAPAIAIWNTEVRSAEVDGLRFTLDDGALAIQYEQRGERSFDYDVRCEMAQGSPMARMYMPPRLVADARARGTLASSERLSIPLDLSAVAAADGEEGGLANLYDTLRVTVRRRGAAPDAAPVAVLQVPRA